MMNAMRMLLNRSNAQTHRQVCFVVVVDVLKVILTLMVVSHCTGSTSCRTSNAGTAAADSNGLALTLE